MGAKWGAIRYPHRSRRLHCSILFGELHRADRFRNPVGREQKPKYGPDRQSQNGVRDSGSGRPRPEETWLNVNLEPYIPNCTTTRTHLARRSLGCFIKAFMQARVRACCIILAGLHWLGAFALWWRRLLHGVTMSDGRAATAPLAGHHPAWLSWSEQILRASDSSGAVVARHAGITGEPDVRSAKTRTTAAS